MRALNYLKKLYPTLIAGVTSWNDVSNNRAYSAGDCSMTTNGVSLYFSLKKDPATAAIAEDTDHQKVPLGLAKSSPMAGLTLNAMVFKHSPYPNAAKAFLQFMLEREQYETWINANSGYWAHPLTAYGDCEVWSGDPEGQDLQGDDEQQVLERLQGADIRGQRCCCSRLCPDSDVRGGRNRRRHA